MLAAFGCGDVESEDACERADEEHQPGRPAQIAADVGAERGEPDVTATNPHDLAQQRPGVALDRFTANGRVVVGRASAPRHHHGPG